MAVTTERDRAVLVATMDDGKANALTFEGVEQLQAAVAGAVEQACPLVLTGRQGTFCAGFDLSVMLSGDLEKVRAILTAGRGLYRSIVEAPIPVIAACGGHALAGGALLLVLLVIAWFAFLRPPPGFPGTWHATALDIAQFNNEDMMINSLIPAALLSNTLKSPDASGDLTIDPSGQYTLAVAGTDHGIVSAQPADISPSANNTLTFTSDITHQSFSANAMLSKIIPNSGGTAFQPQTDPPPDGSASWNLIFFPAGQSTGGGSGDMIGKPVYQGKPDANGNMQLLALIAGSWDPMPMNGITTGDATHGVTARLTISADGHYKLTYALHESGLWKGANGNWTRQGSVTVGYSASIPDSGTYTFTGRNQLNLYDQNGASTWQRGS